MMGPFPVYRCPRRRRAEALGRLRAEASPLQQEALTQALAELELAAENAWDGLLIAGDDDLLGVAWLQRTAGNTAVVWPGNADSPAADCLLQAAAAAAEQLGIAVAQLILTGREGYTPERLARCGFPRLAQLLYLFAEVGTDRVGKRNDGALRFVGRAGDDCARLARLVARTYEGGLDCPALDGARRLEDVLAGYEAQGRHLPDQWYIVSDDGMDAGVLILADHPSTEAWELVYMGVVPERRGRRLGAAIVQFARRCAAQGGARRLILAVDADNAPAVAMYRRAGFVEWDRRTVYARLGSSPR